MTRDVVDIVLDAGIFGFESALESRNLSAQEFHRLQEDRVSVVDHDLHALVSRIGFEPGDGHRDWRNYVKLVVKDNVDVAGLATTSGYRSLKHEVARQDSDVVANWKRWGGAISGKANMDEFALGGSSSNQLFGSTNNPWFGDGTPGGSSGGPAVAVASGYCHVGIGTDTGGSIRNPAAWSGVTALKPSWTGLNLSGVHTQAWSLDTIGFLARSVEDCHRAWQICSGNTSGLSEHDRDIAAQTSTYHDSADLLKSSTIGVVDELFASLEGQIRSEASNWMGDLASRTNLVSVKIGLDDHAMTSCLVTIACEFATGWSEFIANNAPIAEGSQFLVDAGKAISAFEYINAQRYRHALSTYVLRQMRSLDVLLCPTTGIQPTPFGYDEMEFNSAEIGFGSPMWNYAARYTTPWSLTGQPVIAMPVQSRGDGPPLSMQLIGKPHEEDRLASIARAMEVIYRPEGYEIPSWVRDRIRAANPPHRDVKHGDCRDNR